MYARNPGPALFKLAGIALSNSKSRSGPAGGPSSGGSRSIRARASAPAPSVPSAGWAESEPTCATTRRTASSRRRRSSSSEGSRGKAWVMASGTEARPDLRGKIGGDGVDERRVRALDHDAREGLGARVAQEDPPVARHPLLGRAPRVGEAGDLVEGDALSDLHVHEDLRCVYEAGLRREFLPRGGEQRREVQSRQRAVACRREVGADEVSGLLAAEERARLLHLLDDVAVADGCANQRDAAVLQRLLEPPVRHHRSHDGLGLPALALELERPEVKNVVAVEERPLVVGHDDPVRIAVERDSERGRRLDDGARHSRGMQGAATLVDVPPVGRDVPRDDVGARGAKRGRRDLEGRAVRGVHDDAQAVEPVGKAPDEMRHVAVSYTHLTLPTIYSV